jgi:hypothetical protein
MGSAIAIVDFEDTRSLSNLPDLVELQVDNMIEFAKRTGKPFQLGELYCKAGESVIHLPQTNPALSCIDHISKS